MKEIKLNRFIFTVSLVFFLSSNLAFAQSETKPVKTILEANQQELSQSIGHLKRARSLLLSALQEFDKANSIASLEVLIDTVSWRESVADRASELKVAIAPQPRITKESIVYDSKIKIFDNRKK